MTFPWIDAAAALVVAVYSGSAALIGVYALAQLHLLALAVMRREPPLLEGLADPPVVTLQLPIYNERTVVCALLDSIAALDWPPDRLEIQLLDDSTDDTVALAAAKVCELKGRGLDIKHLRRRDRQGYKAGALAWGLEQARGDLLAIFDADFRPRPSFLEQAVATLEAHPEWGLLQARWGHLNRSASVFTAAQAFHLDAHFTIEQAARSRPPLLMGFNGTAGVWRRRAIEDAGGWSADTLTEDLDLALRAQLAGWSLGYVDALEAPAELPERIAAIRTQQHRWMKGGAQVCRKLLGPLWRSGRPLVTRLQSTVHLGSGALFICVLCLCLAAPAAGPLSDSVVWMSAALWPAGLALQGALVVLGLFYAQMCLRREPTALCAGRRFVGDFPAFLALSAGLSLHNSLAVIEGWGGRTTPFVRTPKAGDGSVSSYPVRRVGRVAYLELAIGAWGGVGLLWALAHGRWVLAVFLLSQAVGFLTIGGASLRR